MLENLKRRLSRLEESVVKPISVESFTASVKEQMRYAGGSWDAALQVVVRRLSDGDLDSLIQEVQGHSETN